MNDNFDNLMENVIEQSLFFRPSFTLARAIVAQNQMLASQPLHTEWDHAELDLEENEEIEELRMALDSPPQREPGSDDYQRIIAERLYHFLASLTETPYAREGGRIPLWEVIPGGMATNLGLPRESDLVHSLAEEFRLWLRRDCQGSYAGPWWHVSLDDDDQLVLKETASKQDFLQTLTKKRGGAYAAAAHETSGSG